ncbi:MAG: hypothetical protein GY696_21415, partial [Gammaproteobacteria bacterium]|nr:hypothetical protein [Gammaproteobacteria bacterium]
MSKTDYQQTVAMIDLLFQSERRGEQESAAMDNSATDGTDMTTEAEGIPVQTACSTCMTTETEGIPVQTACSTCMTTETEG